MAIFLKKVLLWAAVLLIIFFFSCENPIQPGLGPKADVVPPKFHFGISPVSGSFISGTTLFTGTSWDDIKIAKVEIFHNKQWRDITTLEIGSGKWTYAFDTTTEPDAPMLVRFRTTDTSGKTTETEQLSYTIKNRPPRIRLNIPGIAELDFDKENLNTLLARKENHIPVVNDLMGLASDTLGIKQGYPRIMFWPREYDTDGDGIIDTNDYVPGEGDTKYGVWRAADMLSDKDGKLAVQFSYPLVKPVPVNGAWELPEPGSRNFEYLEPGTYRFKIQVEDMNGTLNTYPNRTDNTIRDEETGKVPVSPEQHPNQYIQVQLIATTNPVIKILGKFPSFYNGSRDFIVNMSVTGANPIERVRAKIGDGDFNSGTIFRVSHSGGNFYTLTIPPSGITIKGQGILYLEAMDITGRSAGASRDFVVDQTPPRVVINEPANGTQVTSQTQFKGITEDRETSVSALYYALGEEETRMVYPNSDAIWHDTGLGAGGAPSNLITPIPNSWSGSIYSWTWTFDDIGSIASINHPELYVSPYGNPYDNLWKLPLKLKAIDAAGNVTILNHFVIIDPDSDKPRVSINSHSNNQVVGGEVRISGTATDNEWIHGVEVQVRRQPDGQYTNTNSNTWGNPITGNYGNGFWAPATIVGANGSIVSWYYNLNASGNLDPMDKDQRLVEVRVRARDAYLSNPELPKSYSPESSVALIFDSAVPTISDITIVKNGSVNNYSSGLMVSGSFTIQAKIRDEGGINSIKWRGEELGTYLELLNRNNPGRDPWVELPPIRMPGNTLVRGKKYLIRSGRPGLFTPLGASPNDRPGNWFIARRDGAVPPGGSVFEASDFGGVQLFEYTLNIPRDTNSAWYSGRYLNNAGYYTLDIQAQDNTDPVAFMTQHTISLQIDNYYPEGSYTGNFNATTARYSLSGEGRDTGAGIIVQGVDMIAAWFSRKINGADTYISLREKAMGPMPASDLTTLMVKSGGDRNAAPYSIPFPKLSYRTDPDRTAYSNRSVLVINNNGVITGADGISRFYSFTGNPEKVWSAEFDTTGLYDGPVTLHYAIFDRAGNVSYYTKGLIIKNNPPVITRVSLKTDMVGHAPGSEVWTAKDITANWESTNFTSRNKTLRFSIYSNGGNNAINYRVSYITGESPVDTDITNLIPGRVYRITNEGDGSAWLSVGAPDHIAGTAFIASGPAYTGASGKAREILISNTASQSKAGIAPAGVNRIDLSFTAADFGTGGIPDSDLAVPNQARFFLKAWDTMVSGGTELEQLSNFRILGLNIDNIDETEPMIAIAPFGKRFRVQQDSRDADSILEPVAAYTENIVVLGSGVSAGHVQYAEHSNDKVPDVSGSVIILGKVADNQRLTHISAQISGFDGGGGVGQEFILAQWDDRVSAIRPVAEHTVSDVAERNADWGFETLSGRGNFTLEYGHALNWKFAWNSAAIANRVAHDVTITFRVYDIRTGGGPNSASSARMLVDVVPYIARIDSGLSSAYPAQPSAFDRSALGWYPVRDNETISIRGFNFNGAATKVTLNGRGLSITPVNGEETTWIRAALSAADVSGPLTVWVNNIESNNNRNDNTASYNREPNGLNNNTLTDDRNLYVWSIQPWINSTALSSPFMRMDSGSHVYMSYGRETDTMYFNKDRVELDLLEQCFNKYHNTTVASDSSGNMYGAATNTDRLTNVPDRATSFTFYSWGAGSQSLGRQSHYHAGTNKRRLELSYNGSTGIYDVERVQIPRIAVTGAGTPGDPAKIYMSYYDGNNKNNPVIFRYGLSTGPNALTGGIGTDLFNNNPGTAPSAQVIANNNTFYKGGLYTAAGGLSNGRGVIAWHDAPGRRLMYSYSNTLDPSTMSTPDWQANAKVIDADFAGWYVDLAVDSDNGIHIAYYANSTGDLKYVYLPSYYATPRVVTVDSYLSAGTKLMITVRKENGVQIPYISYYHASFSQTSNSVRVVWKIPGTLTHGAINDIYTGAWEAMTVPTANIPWDEYVCNGVPTRRIDTGPLSMVDLTNSVFIGYHTDKNYERAYIKK
ncbi:putative lipoprotein [Treponema primitia ZAS-2]|uniref:Putative lipoprotein n=1 Tax=Treponema primitia (strain ATCC BAA-887 / DSM 12427 / ZAS-2) TaxID=545694 RepID=F5YQ61_TREPZ|nr:hypothetical protein [Treponema primitia]AEF86025.1 putative lipoprotein [Treponema primitia ZAS-2]